MGFGCANLVRSIPVQARMAIGQDLRYTLRTLRRDAGFATFAIVIAGLGIGASSTVFSVVNTLLLRPLPFSSRADWSGSPITDAGVVGPDDAGGITCSICASGTQTLSAVAGYFAFYGVGDTMLTGRGEPERLNAVPVSDNFFQVTWRAADARAGRSRRTK